MSRLVFVFFLFFLLIICSVSGQKSDTMIFSGQASAWLNYNADNDLQLWTGARYIPQLNFERSKGESMFDFEFSANINGTLGIRPFDSLVTDGTIKPYRAWMRYSDEQMEIRLGLQKIDFGSAAMLRPLMWFDRLDPRDPLQLTDGVWGLLGRYYWLNNTNLWLWVLYPSDKPKTWEYWKSNQHFPELGGRIQFPVTKGEMGFSYHWRMSDSRENIYNLSELAEIPENRIGIDGKWDMLVGLWFEGVLIHQGKPMEEFTNQTLLNAGTDYTFNLGSGLNVIFEQIVFSSDDKAFQFSNTIPFTGVSLSYPLSIFDNLNAIVYYDWKNRNSYNYISFRRQYNKFALHLMAYWNPVVYQLPNQQNTGAMFAGKGIQFMLVYDH